ncbi:sugar ABC transporter substrate-binding protein [Spirochaetia bacterium]|nr:sugar ABC transporter substrate-binding protein [Spirochaetia bacterium]
MKKGIVLIVLALMISVGLFAGAKQEAAAGAKKPVTLTVLWFDDGNESEVFLATMQDYLAANPHVKLDLQIVAYSDYEQKIKLMIAGGNPPDVARVTTNNVSSLIDSFLPLQDYVPNLNDLTKNYNPSSLAFAINKQKQVIAFPTEATANGMLVNKTAFRNAGIDVDEVSKTWTWASWEEIVKKVIAANPAMKYGLAVDFTPHRFSTIMYEFGGHFMNSTQTGMDFSNQGTINAIKFFKDMHDKDLIPKSVWLGSENPAELFQAGLVAGHIGGSWNILTYNNNVKNFEWGAVNTPKGTISSSVPGGKFIASFKGCANPEEAVALMLAFSDKAHNERYVRETFNLTSRSDLNVTYSSNTKDFQSFADQLKVTPAFTANEWNSPALAGISTYIREQLVEVLRGRITAEAAAKNVDERGAPLFK